MKKRGPSMAIKVQPARPPGPPWTPLVEAEPPTGYLSVFYSDDLSPLAVRHVTRPGDCKSDPNLETGTFGLFSTCEPTMRSAVIHKRTSYLFFVASRREAGCRVLVGLYHLAWWCAGPLNGARPDVCLAADHMRFVHPPVRLRDLPEPSRSVAMRQFRTCCPVDHRVTAQLMQVLVARAVRTADYATEIDRLERFNAFHTGFRYPGWKQMEPFTWDLAPQFLRPPHPNVLGRQRVVLNTSQTGAWRCVACGAVSMNRSRLRRCPECKELATLEPVSVKSA